MNDEEYVKEVTEMISDILRNQIEKYFDGNPTPDNIKMIEEYINRFLFDKFITDNYRFEVTLECNSPGSILVTECKAFKDNVRIN